MRLPISVAVLVGLASSALAYEYSTVSEHCNDLYSFTGDAGLEAPTKVKNVTYMAASGTTPAYCAVTMYVEAYTGVLMYLPAEGKDWKGVYSAHGCGGSCGVLGLDYAYGYGTGPYGFDLLQRGYVASMTDMGHNNADYANSSISNWFPFRNNRTVEYNFAYYSTHLLAVAGKAITEFYFEKPIKHSFFRGGSTGGRQGLMIAQRYPHDFDAILVGYAASNETGIGGLQFPWLAQASMHPNRSLILTQADVVSLHLGAVAECDGNDGLVDGIVDPSYKCDFDPITILCSKRKMSSCLSNMDKVTAARKMYSFPSNKYSSKLINARYVPGSELEWSTWTTDYGWKFAQSFIRDATFQADLPLNWTIDQYDWDTYPYMLGKMEDIYGVGNGDLTIFRDRGGKIIHYQGWADANVSPMWNLNYYKHVLERMGGLESVQEFYRFFMYPGMAHIDVSESSTVAWRCDYYDYLEQWYLEDKAPEKLVVTHFNLTSKETIDYRPYFPYPLTPKYVGEGKPTNTLEDVTSWKGVSVPASNQGIV